LVAETRGGRDPLPGDLFDGKIRDSRANALQIADQIGYVEARDYFLQALENELEDWFDGREPSALYYNDTWRTVIPVPSGFGSSAKLNDHHFQYGYFVLSARSSPSTTQSGRRGSRTASTSSSETRPTGTEAIRGSHSFATWTLTPAFVGQRPRGIRRRNNEESSSEDVNFSAGAVLVGRAHRQHRRSADSRIFLYTQEVAAIEQYWWDIDQKVFPKGFGHTAVAMVWGPAGATTRGGNPNPISCTHQTSCGERRLALHGRHSGLRRSHYEEVVRRNRGEPSRGAISCGCTSRWPNPSARSPCSKNDRYFHARVRQLDGHDVPLDHELGGTRATRHPGRGGHATFAVFSKGAKRTHVAFNPTDKPLKVSFSERRECRGAPRQIALVSTP